MQRATTLDIGFDIKDQLLHCRFFMAIADDFERLHHGSAGGHHRCELATKYRDIFTGYFSATDATLRFYPRRGDSLASEICSERGFTGCKRLTANFVAALVLALPNELDIFLRSRCC